MTPLHVAACGSYPDSVKYIIQAGADVNLKDNLGVSEEEYSTDCGLMLLIWL